MGGECGGTSTVLVRGKVVGPAFFFVWGLMEESQGPKASINGCGKDHEKKEMLSGYFSSTSVSERNTAHCTLHTAPILFMDFCDLTRILVNNTCHSIAPLFNLVMLELNLIFVNLNLN